MTALPVPEPATSIRALYAYEREGWAPSGVTGDWAWESPVAGEYHIGGRSRDTMCGMPGFDLVLVPPTWVFRYGMKPCDVCAWHMRRREPYRWKQLKEDLRRAS